MSEALLQLEKEAVNSSLNNGFINAISIGLNEVLPETYSVVNYPTDFQINKEFEDKMNLADVLGISAIFSRNKFTGETTEQQIRGTTVWFDLRDLYPFKKEDMQVDTDEPYLSQFKTSIKEGLKNTDQVISDFLLENGFDITNDEEIDLLVENGLKDPHGKELDIETFVKVKSIVNILVFNTAKRMYFENKSEIKRYLFGIHVQADLGFPGELENWERGERFYGKVDLLSEFLDQQSKIPENGKIRDVIKFFQDYVNDRLQLAIKDEKDGFVTERKKSFNEVNEILTMGFDEEKPNVEKDLYMGIYWGIDSPETLGQICKLIAQIRDISTGVKDTTDAWYASNAYSVNKIFRNATYADYLKPVEFLENVLKSYQATKDFMDKFEYYNKTRMVITQIGNEKFSFYIHKNTNGFLEGPLELRYFLGDEWEDQLPTVRITPLNNEEVILGAIQRPYLANHTLTMDNIKKSQYAIKHNVKFILDLLQKNKAFKFTQLNEFATQLNDENLTIDQTLVIAEKLENIWQPKGKNLKTQLISKAGQILQNAEDRDNITKGFKHILNDKNWLLKLKEVEYIAKYLPKKESKDIIQDLINAAKRLNESMDATQARFSEKEDGEFDTEYSTGTSRVVSLIATLNILQQMGYKKIHVPTFYPIRKHTGDPDIDNRIIGSTYEGIYKYLQGGKGYKISGIQVSAGTANESGSYLIEIGDESIEIVPTNGGDLKQKYKKRNILFKNIAEGVKNCFPAKVA